MNILIGIEYYVYYLVLIFHVVWKNFFQQHPTNKRAKFLESPILGFFPQGKHNERIWQESLEPW